jgi:hypothetical protein
MKKAAGQQGSSKRQVNMACNCGEVEVGKLQDNRIWSEAHLFGYSNR